MKYTLISGIDERNEPAMLFKHGFLTVTACMDLAKEHNFLRFIVSWKEGNETLSTSKYKLKGKL